MSEFAYSGVRLKNSVVGSLLVRCSAKSSKMYLSSSANLYLFTVLAPYVGCYSQRRSKDPEFMLTHLAFLKAGHVSYRPGHISCGRAGGDSQPVLGLSRAMGECRGLAEKERKLTVCATARARGIKRAEIGDVCHHKCLDRSQNVMAECEACQLIIAWPFLHFSMARRGRKIAPPPSPNWRFEQDFAESTLPTSGVTITKPA